MADINKLKQDIVFRVKLRGEEFVFHSTWGLFSPRRIDDGSYLLLHQIDVTPDAVTLDLGCGYGALGIVIARLSPQGCVHMVDKDFVAVEYAKKNAQRNAITNCEIYLSNAFRDVPDILFDNIVSNLPANVGKELLSIILHDAKAHLKPGGKLYVVTIAGLRAFIRRNFEQIFGHHKKLKQAKGYSVALGVRGEKTERDYGD
jgi:16S rRNA (guanine1207-N2)-methyltransferase